MGAHHQPAVANPIRIAHREQIHQNLGGKVHENQTTDLFKGDGELVLKDDKQKRRQIVHNGLSDVPQIAGLHGVPVGVVHDPTLPVLSGF